MNTGRRVGDALIKTALTAGIAPRNYAVLTVPGRRTGQPRSTPVRPLEHGGHRYLVAPYGAVGWVQNLRSAETATLRRGRHAEAVQPVECDAAESGPVLKEYARAVPVTRPYFDATPEDPPERFGEEADRHPVFRVG